MGDKNQDRLDRMRSACHRAPGATAWAGLALVMALWPTFDVRLASESGLRTRADPVADPGLPGMREDPDVAKAAGGRTLFGYFECGGCHHIDGIGGRPALVPGDPRTDIAGRGPANEAMRVGWIGMPAPIVPATPALRRRPDP